MVDNTKVFDKVTKQLKQLKGLTDNYLITHVHKGADFLELALVQQYASYFYGALALNEVETLCTLAPYITNLTAEQLFTLILKFCKSNNHKRTVDIIDDCIFDNFSDDFNDFYYTLDNYGLLTNKLIKGSDD